MYEIKALEKLRTAARNMAKGRNLENHEECNLLLLIADEIEAEIAERFMELPVDADGVPIHVGDYLEFGDTRGMVVALSYCPERISTWSWMRKGDDCWYNAALANHVKHDTVEDVLSELVNVHTYKHESCTEEVISKYADEIRKLMGGES